MPNVLHVCAGNLFGGVEGMLITLARYQSTCPDLNQHFAVCFEGRLASGLEALQYPVHRLGAVRASRPWTIYQAQKNLRILINRERFDWVLCHSAWPLGLLGPAVTRNGTPLALWLHDAAQGKHWVERLAKRAKPDLAICNSRYTAATLPLIFPNLAPQVLYCPVPNPPTPKPGTRSQVRTSLATPEQAVVILIAARFETWKGHAPLIEALALLNTDTPWKCWIAGGAQRPHEQQHLDTLQRRVQETKLSDRVQFLGHRSDVPELMAAADIYCQPNTAPEPFGISFVEALYAGLTVVTSNFGGAAEILTPDCGVLLPPNDAPSLARELQSLINNPTRRTTAEQHGPARATALCDPAQQLHRLKALLSPPSKAR